MMDEASEAEYSRFVEALMARTADALRRVRTSPHQQLEAVRSYYREGLAADLTPEELLDFLGVSSPSILELAGYSEPESERLLDAFAADGLGDEAHPRG